MFQLGLILPFKSLMKFLLSLFLFVLTYVHVGAQKYQTVRTVFFDSGKSSMNKSSVLMIKNLHDSLFQKSVVTSIRVFGYCDSIGSVAYNDSLSLKRAQTVKAELQNLGFPDSVFRILKGYGKNYPVNNNDDSMQRQLNRRVTLSIDYDVKSEINSQSKIQNPTPNKSNIDTSNLAVGARIELKNIYFVGGSHQFLKSSDSTLFELLSLMLGMPTLEIEIVGHICCLPSNYIDGIDQETGLQNLSKARSIAVGDYLIKNGISRARLRFKGMGPKQKITQESNLEEQARNRRVEIVVIKR